MSFNTSTLGYKLTSGKLKERRVHSEQLGKYLAGLIDADGSCCLTFCKYKSSTGEVWYKPTFKFELLQSFSNDMDGTLLRSLQDFYDLGTIGFRSLNDKWSMQCFWHISNRQISILFNRIGKHLRIKATHFENLIWLFNEVQGMRMTEEQIVELKEFSRCSRANSRWLKHPKHPAWAWLAGYFDGDGHYRFRQRERVHKKRGFTYLSTEASITVMANITDEFVLDFIKKALKGSIHHHKKGTFLAWKRYLGPSSKAFSLKLLKNLRKYSCLQKKYDIINKMINYHEQLAETKRKRYLTI